MELTNSKRETNQSLINKKGFTLIELLAVIIIMGIIALITIPVIKDLIDDSKKNSFRNSALGIVNAANQYYLNSKLNGENFEELTFTVQEGKMVAGDKQLLFNGKTPVGSSYVKINKMGEVAINITDGDFYASKDYDEVGVLVTGDESSALTREELASRITELEALLNTKIGELNSKVDNTKNELSNKDTELSSKVDGNTKSITDMTRIGNANNIFLKNYPVGSIYISTSSTNPGSLYGGTWERYGNGKTLVGVSESETEFATVNKTGGEKKHTLSVAEMPSHTHKFQYWIDGVATGFGSLGKTGTSTQDKYLGFSNSVASFSTYKVTLESAGSSSAHNNLQPYITVYMWRRTA